MKSRTLFSCNIPTSGTETVRPLGTDDYGATGILELMLAHEEIPVSSLEDLSALIVNLSAQFVIECLSSLEQTFGH